MGARPAVKFGPPPPLADALEDFYCVEPCNGVALYVLTGIERPQK